MPERYFLNGNYSMETALSSFVFLFFSWLPFYFTPVLCQTAPWKSRLLLQVCTGVRRKLGCDLRQINLCCLHVQLFQKQFQVSRLAIYNVSDACLCLIQQAEANTILFEMCLKEWGSDPSRLQSLNSHWNESLNSSGELRQLNTISGMA